MTVLARVRRAIGEFVGPYGILATLVAIVVVLAIVGALHLLGLV